MVRVAGPQAPHRHRPRRADEHRTRAPPRCSPTSRPTRTELQRAARRRVGERCVKPALGRGRHPGRDAGTTLDERRARSALRVLPGAGLPGADAARRRPRPPVPLHLRAARSTSRSASATPRTDARSSPRLKVPPMLPRVRRALPPATAPRRALHPARGPHLQPPRRPLPRDGGARPPRVPSSPATRTSRSRRTRPRTSSQALEAELLRRRFGPPIRLEITDDMDDVTRSTCCMRELDITEQEVYRLPGAARPAAACSTSPRIDRPEPALPAARADHGAALQPPTNQRAPRRLRRHPQAATCCVHHPYESFATSVQAFLEQAGERSRTCSRSSRRCTARRATARSSRRSSTRPRRASRCSRSSRSRRASTSETTSCWARKLEKAGVHVVYGLVGLKTHCKLALVIRQENGRAAQLQPHRHGQLQPQDEPHLRGPRAVHGRRPGRRRPHPAVQRADAATRSRRSSSACSSPRCTCARACSGSSTTRAAQRPRPASRRASASRSTRWSTSAIIDALYRASQAGVHDRGVGARHLLASSPACRARARTSRCAASWAAISSTRASSRSTTTATRRSYIGSADMMHRNLDRRVEALVRVTAPAHIAESSTSCSTLAMADTHQLVAPRAGRRMGAPTSATSRGNRSTTCRRPHAADRPAYRARARAADDGRPRSTRPAAWCWRIVDGKLRVLVIHRTAVPRRHAAQGQGRPRRDARRDGGARDLRRDRHPGRARRARSASRATRCPASARRSCTTGPPRRRTSAIRSVGVRPQQRDRRARVDVAHEGARAALELPARRRDPRVRSLRLVERGRARAPSRSCALRHAKAVGRRRVEGHRMPRARSSSAA